MQTPDNMLDKWLSWKIQEWKLHILFNKTGILKYNISHKMESTVDIYKLVSKFFGKIENLVVCNWSHFWKQGFTAVNRRFDLESTLQIGPSKVRAPTQQSGHYTRHYFSFSSFLLTLPKSYCRVTTFCMGS